MRRLGLALMIVGLVAVLVASTVGEFASATAENYLTLAFYAGIAMVLVGAALVAVRVMWARRTR